MCRCHSLRFILISLDGTVFRTTFKDTFASETKPFPNENLAQIVPKKSKKLESNSMLTTFNYTIGRSDIR